MPSVEPSVSTTTRRRTERTLRGGRPQPDGALPSLGSRARSLDAAGRPLSQPPRPHPAPAIEEGHRQLDLHPCRRVSPELLPRVPELSHATTWPEHLLSPDRPQGATT
uniref:Uncharacterized protein n=1 Tax=Leersia perrieri TaxID=77586 RepID=A0A0D9W1R7_9ORYZ